MRGRCPDSILYNESMACIHVHDLPLSDVPSISVDVLEFLRRIVGVVVLVAVLVVIACKDDERANPPFFEPDVVLGFLGIGGGGANPPLCVV